VLPVTNFTEQLLEDLLNQARRRDDEHQEQINRVLDNTSLVIKTPWLRYNKWESRFADQDMKELHALTDLPKAIDEDETILANTVDKVLRACWDGFHDCQSREWNLLPFWLASVARDKENTKPFRQHIDPDTFTRYIGYWQSYILLCYRMHLTNDSRLQFTSAQAELLESMQLLIQNYTEDMAEELYELLFQLSVVLICHSDYAKQSYPLCRP